MSKPLRSFRMAFSILRHLAINPAGSPYSVARDIKVDRPTVRAALKILTSANLVSLAGKPKKLPTGLQRKTYKVTPQGIVALLQAHPDHIKLTRKDARDLAEKQKAFLPLIFGKWDHFREKNMEDFALEALIVGAKATENEIDRLATFSTGKKPEATLLTEECVHRHDIYEFMLCRAWNHAGFSDQTWRHWLMTIRGNPELLRMSEQEFKRLHVEAVENVWSLDWLLDILQATEDKITEDPFLWPGGEFFSFRAEEGREQANDLEKQMDQFAKYKRAKALDEGKPPPSRQELIAHWFRGFLQKPS